MKLIWKISLFLGIIAILGRITMHTNAIDFRQAYDAALQKATFAKERVSSAISSGIEYISGDKELTAIRINPYKNTIAHVRIGNELNRYERAYLEKRKPKVKTALEKILNKPLSDDQVPHIAIVASGGGYRAMLGTIGSLLALEKIGILDATTYMVGLSGSTWAMAPWISTGMTLPHFKDYIQKTIQQDIKVSGISEAKSIIDMLSVKLTFDEPITFVDIYGGLLANRLLNYFGTDAQRVYLSQQAERVKNADIPYPIYTAIDAREAVSREPHWFEYTPHEIGSSYFGVYVPAWAYGRLFENGTSLNFAPEQSLGSLMGTWGSAFGVHVGRAWEEISGNVPSVFKDAIEKKMIDSLTGKRINSSWIEIFNFTYGMANQELNARKTLKFVDAGIDFNLPYPPISGERPERKAEVIVFLDFSGGSLVYSMKKVEEYARRKGLKFPKIDYTHLEMKALSIFMDPVDTTVPVVIYFPRVSERGLWETHKLHPEVSAYSNIADFDFAACTNTFNEACGTSNFQYLADNSGKIINQMYFNIMVHKDEILKTINWVVDHKK